MTAIFVDRPRSLAGTNQRACPEQPAFAVPNGLQPLIPWVACCACWPFWVPAGSELDRLSLFRGLTCTCNSMQAIMQQLLPVYLQPVREGRVQVTDKGAAQHLYTEAKSHVQASHKPSGLALLQSSGKQCILHWLCWQQQRS